MAEPLDPAVWRRTIRSRLLVVAALLGALGRGDRGAPRLPPGLPARRTSATRPEQQQERTVTVPARARRHPRSPRPDPRVQRRRGLGLRRARRSSRRSRGTIDALCRRARRLHAARRQRRCEQQFQAEAALARVRAPRGSAPSRRSASAALKHRGRRPDEGAAPLLPEPRAGGARARVRRHGRDRGWAASSDATRSRMASRGRRRAEVPRAAGRQAATSSARSATRRCPARRSS